MANHNITGKTGEEIAAEYLVAKGYLVIAINRRFGRAEIDIIAQIGNDLVFVEVKTRTNAWFGFPEESIDDKKIELMAKAAELYLMELNEDREIRFDVISLVLERDTFEIIHIEDAFLPGSHEF